MTEKTHSLLFLQFMMIASIGARMKVQKVRMTLIVAPKSVLGFWENEAKRFLPKFAKSVRIEVVHGQTPSDRKKIIRNAWRGASTDRPHVIISSWGLAGALRTLKDFLPPLGKRGGSHWDYVIFDEAHRIKDHKSTRAKCCRKICHKKGTKRFLLTGTPFQNDIDELWSIVHLATAGKVLEKNIKHFNKKYGKPTRDARCRNASRYAERQGEKANEELQELLKPYVLRRLKKDHLSKELPVKQETCVWVKASKQQKMLYKVTVESKMSLADNILSSDTKLARSARIHAFRLIQVLMQICNHPLLHVVDDADNNNKRKGISKTLEGTELSAIIRGSKKLELSVHMLEAFKENGHKVLLFSHSTQNLDIIQYVLLKHGSFTVCRLDG